MRALVLGLLLVPAGAGADPSPAPSAVSFAGFLQPQLRLRQDAPTVPFDEDGFRLRHARLAVAAQRSVDRLDAGVTIEVGLAPEVELLDAYASAGSCLVGGGRWQIDAGQLKAPVSRQALLSDADLSFVDKAALAELAPGWQLGALGRLTVPHLPMVALAAGVFDGEGRNRFQNLDQRYLYAGRVEVRPLGRDVAVAESAHGGDFVVVGVSVARNRTAGAAGVETAVTMGADLGFAMRGVSGAIEYLQVDHDFSMAGARAFRANGFAAQVAMLVPVTGAARRLELGARFEEIDRNDTMPILAAGDPDQSLRSYTAVATWYQVAHELKLQLQASHVVEIEFLTAELGDARYANDTVLVQAQYRSRLP